MKISTEKRDSSRFPEITEPILEKIYITIGLYGEDYVEVVKGNLKVGDEISTTYEAKKTSSNNSQRGGPMGRPPF